MTLRSSSFHVISLISILLNFLFKEIDKYYFKFRFLLGPRAVDP